LALLNQGLQSSFKCVGAQSVTVFITSVDHVPPCRGLVLIGFHFAVPNGLDLMGNEIGDDSVTVEVRATASSSEGFNFRTHLAFVADRRLANIFRHFHRFPSSP
jgi:hypothetical protein